MGAHERRCCRAHRPQAVVRPAAAARTPEAAGDLVEECWLTDGFRDDAQCEEWRARSRAMVERYVSGLDPHDEPRGVERTVALRTDTLAVSGRVDRIDERRVVDADGVIDEAADEDDDTELVVVDYKTGRWVPDTDEARGSLALALYALGAARTLRQPCRTVELHHLPSASVARWVHTEESLTRHLRRAEAIGAEAAAAEVEWKDGLADALTTGPRRFPPRPGSMCAWCDFARHCPEGRAVAPDQGTLGRAARLIPAGPARTYSESSSNQTALPDECPSHPQRSARLATRNSPRPDSGVRLVGRRWRREHRRVGRAVVHLDPQPRAAGRGAQLQRRLGVPDRVGHELADEQDRDVVAVCRVDRARAWSAEIAAQQPSRDRDLPRFGARAPRAAPRRAFQSPPPYPSAIQATPQTPPRPRTRRAGGRGFRRLGRG